MSDERPVDVTRRSLLVGLTAAGSAGALLGVGTAAVLKDNATFPDNAMTAGSLEVVSEWLDEDGGVSLDFTGLTPGDTRVGTAEVALRGNPAWVWFASTCPSPEQGIEDAVNVRLTVYPDCGPDGTDLFGGYVSLREALAAAATGTLLTDGPMEGGQTACVEFRVTMPEDLNGVSPDVVGGDEVDVSFQFAAEQKRHNVAVVNPFAGTTCEEGACVCTELGTYELGDAQLLSVGDRLPLLVDDEPTGYELVVTDVVNKDEATTTADQTATTADQTTTANGNGKPRSDDSAPETVGAAFELSGPESLSMCRVDVKGGSGRKGGTDTEKLATYTIDPPATSTDVLSAPNGTAVSHVVVWVCQEGN